MHSTPSPAHTTKLLLAAQWALTGFGLFCLVGALPAALRIRCTMQRCHAAPGKTSCIARLRPSWASLVTQMTPSTPRARSDSRNDFQPS